MKLLELSIWEDGYTQPVVCCHLPDEDVYEVVDGYHRYLIMRDVSPRIREREHGMLPVVLLDADIQHRMASTIRHNRARGVHGVELMTAIVQDLVDAGMGDKWIMRHLGMDADELLRHKQLTGLAAVFADREYSQAPEGV